MKGLAASQSAGTLKFIRLSSKTTKKKSLVCQVEGSGAIEEHMKDEGKWSQNQIEEIRKNEKSPEKQVLEHQGATLSLKKLKNRANSISKPLIPRSINTELALEDFYSKNLILRRVPKIASQTSSGQKLIAPVIEPIKYMKPPIELSSESMKEFNISNNDRFIHTSDVEHAFDHIR